MSYRGGMSGSGPAGGAEKFSPGPMSGGLAMHGGKIAGKVLLRREGGLREALGKDFRSSKVLFLLCTIIVMGGSLTIAVSPVARALPLPDESVKLCFNLLIAGLAALFFIMAATLTMEDRATTVITDKGILYGGIFQRWAEIRCCVMRRTRRGLVVSTRSRRRLRMYFRGQDTDVIERLFRDFCSAETFLPDCGSSH